MRDAPEAREARRLRLAAVAAKRASDTEARARRALMTLRQRGEAITFAAVAQAACVSESYLYAHGDLAPEIRRLRGAVVSRRGKATVDQATAESLRTKLHVVTARVVELEEELAQAKIENQALLSELVELRRRQARRAI